MISMYSLDGNVSVGNITKKAVGALEIYGDGTVLANASWIKGNGYSEPKMHIFRGKLVDTGPGSMTIRNDEGIIKLSGINFTDNLRYDDMASKPKVTGGGKYIRRDTKWYKDMNDGINAAIDGMNDINREMRDSIKVHGEKYRRELEVLAKSEGLDIRPSYNDITEKIGHPKLLNKEEYIEHMNNILILAQVVRNDGKEMAEDAIPILSEYANDALAKAERLGLYEITEDFARDFVMNGLYIK